ncbi:MAG: isoprenylcysteine carboxylmethyltransferase family protein [Anaerolineae bacterium]|nr:isoprenylcysteine carboxylmethyltransferase family protein [Anaerolineae bacterium]
MHWSLSILILIIFFTAYAVLHSLLAALPVKNRARRVFGAGVERWYRLVYNIIGGATLLPLFPLLVWLPTQTLYIVPAPWSWLMVGGQLLALAGLAVALLQTGLFHFLGLAQLVADRPAESGTLNVGGFYGWVRHPLYFFSLLFLWLTPAMTANLLTVYLLFTLYFYLGSFFEERRLIAEFGSAYRDYQQRVPRLLPMRFRLFRPQTAEQSVNHDKKSRITRHISR